MLQAPEAVKDRIAALRDKFPFVVPMQVFATWLDKSDPDAVLALRDALSQSGLFDYELISELGADKNKVSLPVEFVTLGFGATASSVPIGLNLYRSKNGDRGDRRFSLSWTDTTLRYHPLEYVAFIISGANQVLLVNLSRGLPPESIGASFAGLLDALEALVAPGLAGGAADILEAQSDERFANPVIWSEQGFLQDAALRRGVEEYALARAISHYTFLGAETIEVFGKPYDLRVQMSTRDIHVEVKGSRGRLDRVLLTKNEVTHARVHADTELIVIDEIRRRVLDDGKWELEGGRLRLWRKWVPADGSLTALQFSHELSEPDTCETAIWSE